MVNLVRPPLAETTFSHVLNTLARALPSSRVSADLAGWEENDWLAAEWLVYWQNATSWLVKYILEMDLSPPPSVWDRLQAVDADSRARTRKMLAATTELLTALENAGILALPLKGVVLAPVYYPDPGMRPLGDIDILVHEKDIPDGLQVLESLGYTYYTRSAKDFVYLRGSRKKNIWAPDNVRPVEMHFRLDWYQTTGIKDELSDILWRGSGYQSYGQDGIFLLPSQVGNFLTVCAHTTADRINQTAKLIQILDIQLVAGRMSAEDWSILLEETPGSIARLIYPGLYLASKYARIEAPPEVIQLLGRASPPGLQTWVAEIEFAQAETKGAFNRGIKTRSARVMARTPAERWVLLWRLIFPRRWDLSVSGENPFPWGRFRNLYARTLHSPFWPVCYAFIYAARLRMGLRSLFLSG